MSEDETNAEDEFEMIAIEKDVNCAIIRRAKVDPSIGMAIDEIHIHLAGSEDTEVLADKAMTIYREMTDGE